MGHAYSITNSYNDLNGRTYADGVGDSHSHTYAHRNGHGYFDQLYRPLLSIRLALRRRQHGRLDRHGGPR
jgi:hypothetical protein